VSILFLLSFLTEFRMKLILLCLFLRYIKEIYLLNDLQVFYLVFFGKYRGLTIVNKFNPVFGLFFPIYKGRHYQ
jgi:hypothetical protein